MEKWILFEVQISVLVLAMILLRCAIKKLPKLYSYLLWVLLFVHILIPFQIPLKFLWLPGVQQTQGTGRLGQVQEAVSGQTHSTSLSALWPAVLLEVWVLGMGILFAYNIAAVIQLRKKVKNAFWLKENIYVSSRVLEPFTMGIFRPVIYLPAGLSGEERDYILRHEQIHVQRKDNLVKNVAFFLTCIHWFNPMVWAAFFLMERDMEMSCDEAVIRDMGTGIAKSYSQSLLDFAVGRKMAFTPLTFGEVSVKQRVKNVLTYSKTKKKVRAAGVLVLFIASVGIFTSCQSADSAESTETPDEILASVDAISSETEELLPEDAVWSETEELPADDEEIPADAEELPVEDAVFSETEEFLGDDEELPADAALLEDPPSEERYTEDINVVEVPADGDSGTVEVYFYSDVECGTESADDTNAAVLDE